MGVLVSAPPSSGTARRNSNHPACHAVILTSTCMRPPLVKVPRTLVGPKALPAENDDELSRWPPHKSCEFGSE